MISRVFPNKFQQIHKTFISGHIQKLSNCCRHKHDQSFHRFFELLLAVFCHLAQICYVVVLYVVAPSLPALAITLSILLPGFSRKLKSNRVNETDYLKESLWARFMWAVHDMKSPIHEFTNYTLTPFILLPRFSTLLLGKKKSKRLNKTGLKNHYVGCS